LSCLKQSYKRVAIRVYDEVGNVIETHYGLDQARKEIMNGSCRQASSFCGVCIAAALIMDTETVCSVLRRQRGVGST